MYWLPRPESDRRDALAFELFADLDLSDVDASPPCLQHLIAEALPKRYSERKGQPLRGTSHFGDLEQYLHAP